MSAPGTILAASEWAQAVTSPPCGALHPMLPKILGKMRFLQPRQGSLVCRARQNLARPSGLCRSLTSTKFVLVGRPDSDSTCNDEGADAAGNGSKASNQQRSDYDGPPLNILVVGSTGQGKSALGNFFSELFHGSHLGRTDLSGGGLSPNRAHRAVLSRVHRMAG